VNIMSIVVYSKSGLSKRGIDRMHRVLSGHVERQEIPGIVALVSHHDAVHVETLGTMFVGQSAPMQRDTIFRIASITKPIAAVAALMLVEDCKIRLDDAIDPWLPELAKRRVLKSIDAEIDDTVPARRAITLRDLLTSTMGIGSVMAMPDTYPIQRAIREYRIGGDGPKMPTDYPPADEWLKKLAALPLIAQPGERWMYHVSYDLLGVLIARVAGQSFGKFLRERLFEPLGMKDTSFQLPADKVSRLPGFYFFNRQSNQSNKLDFFDDPKKSAWTSESGFEAGGGALLSTIDDYFAFSRMLLNKGRYSHGREQILSSASVELMITDHVTAAQRAGSEIFFGDFASYGFGVGIAIRRTEMYQTPGRFGWDGGFGTSAYIDPAKDAIGILFTQRLVDSPVAPQVYTDFWTTAYGALE
jgi:CubicO group peptidase (beta-lactamase class C family)